MSELSRREFLGVAGSSLALPGIAGAFSAAAAAAPIEPSASAQFAVAFQAGTLVSLRRVGDAFDTNYVQAERRLGDVLLRYRFPGSEEWRTFDSATADGSAEVRAAAGGAERQWLLEADGAPLLALAIRFDVRDAALEWTLELENRSGRPLEIGDLAIPLPLTRSFDQGEQQRPGTVLKHGLISGHGSFLFWMRSNSVGPYLLLTPAAGTQLEYWESQGGYRVFVHSRASGAAARARGTKWRQPHTGARLAASGEEARRRYGLTFRWAADYQDVRDQLVAAGLVDVHVVPGMTVPSDLFARFALRSRKPIHGIDAEHPEQTRLRALGRRGDAQLYEVRFARLGENRLTVRYGQGETLHLEWFVTEPLETLIAKRAAFIAAKQIRDAGKWYDGLLAEWANDTRVLLSPDNYDRIRGWRIYEVTCDDPGLSKPAYLASKVAEYPTQDEVAALDYYIEHFVWGGLQRTSDEVFAYGIYGIPDWKTNRESRDPGRNGRLHLWRIYDYPHIALLYFGLYRVAKHHPQIRTALSADEYLRRACHTAIAMFTIPTEIEGWSAYRTGLYNELVIVDILGALEERGWDLEFQRLRLHWERKVQFFINGTPNLFQSEYAFDSTGFEATHALAKYALAHADRLAAERPANEKFPPIPVDATKRFLEKQLAANLFCRGWIEPAYYYLGSDYRGGGGERYTLTYMSQMGGWSVLDYALHHAADTHPLLRLGYASILSAWALLNCGTPASNYGYWYPGPENDGAAGGGFEPAPFGTTWLEQPHTRGSWYYSCEIDLGFCGALRAAATILADDPLFDRFCYGGDVRAARGGIEVVPKDGVRRRFHARIREGSLDLVLENDRFARGQAIRLGDALSRIEFRIESENPQPHRARLRFAGAPGRYAVRSRGAQLLDLELHPDADASIELPVAGGTPVAFEIARVG